jgi:hypothetical protein
VSVIYAWCTDCELYAPVVVLAPNGPQILTHPTRNDDGTCRGTGRVLAPGSETLTADEIFGGAS